MGEVDPRACGVDPMRQDVNAKAAGGSPRMRGRPSIIVRGVGMMRWIPAHAG